MSKDNVRVTLLPDQSTVNLLAKLPYYIAMGTISGMFLFLFFIFIFVNLRDAVVAGLVGTAMSGIFSVLGIMIGYFFAKENQQVQNENKDREIFLLKEEIESLKRTIVEP